MAKTIKHVGEISCRPSGKFFSCNLITDTSNYVEKVESVYTDVEQHFAIGFDGDSAYVETMLDDNTCEIKKGNKGKTIDCEGGY